MYNQKISQILHNERSGIFLLAGLDNGRFSQSEILTVHAINDTLSVECEQFIINQIKLIDASLRVKFRRYAFKNLYNTKSLEHLVKQFNHEEILYDPTGVFSRSAELIHIARVLREEFGNCLSSILWQSTTGKIQLVFKGNLLGSTSGFLQSIEQLEQDAIQTFQQHSSSSLLKAVVEIKANMEIPIGAYTPVDALSFRAVMKNDNPLNALWKVSGIAAAIGLGSVVAASASISPAVQPEAKPVMLPGVSAFPGLTTLGENAFGINNAYRSMGGLKLYFGNSEPILMAACGMTDIIKGELSCLKHHFPGSENYVGGRDPAPAPDIGRARSPRSSYGS
jgi:hypothetical protein